MNKKVLLGVALLAIAGVAVFNVNFSSQKNSLSDVSLANVEALAEEFVTVPYPGKADEWDSSRNCIRQCVACGDGCTYVYGITNNC